MDDFPNAEDAASDIGGIDKQLYSDREGLTPRRIEAVGRT
jgi:hypothetical protein